MPWILQVTEFGSTGIGVNPAGDAGDVSPPIFWLVGTSMEMSPPIFGAAFAANIDVARTQ